MDALDALRTLTVPTLANAVEVFGVVPPNTGLQHAAAHVSLPVVRHVRRATRSTVHGDDRSPPDDAPEPIDEPEYWKWLEGRARGPEDRRCSRISTTRPAARCGASGTANVHRALGCVGTITQGAVRDLDALERLGFHTFATSVSVAHGYGVFVGYGEPVTVAGLRVETGDLLVADLHGVLRIPPEIPLAELVEVGREIDRLESEIFACCQSPTTSASSSSNGCRSRCSPAGPTLEPA